METLMLKQLHEKDTWQDTRMDKQDERLDKAEDRIEDLERLNILIENRLEATEKEILAIKETSLRIENTVLKDGRETRESNREQMQRVFDILERREKHEADATESGQLTKRTKMQTWRDICLAAFGALGTLVGGIIAYQELIVGLFK